MSYTHTKGDTFSYSGAIAVAEYGVPLTSLVGWTGAAQVKDFAGVLVENLSFVWVDAANRVAKLESVTNTAAWPEGVVHLVLRLTTPGGLVVSSEPVSFIVKKGFA